MPDAPSPPRHISGTTTRIIIGYVQREAGAEGVRRLLLRAGETRPVEALLDDAGWSTYDQVMALFEAAVELFENPRVVQRIGADALDYQESSPILPLFRSLGSPAELLKNITLAAAKLQNVGHADLEELHDERAVVTFAARAGFPRHPLHCDYFAGMITTIPRIFGLPAAVVEHDVCQARGAERCVYHVTWSNRPSAEALGERVEHLELRLRQVTEQFEELQTTAADLVSADDVDTVLRRIAARAAAAVRAPRFVLVARTADGARRVVADGLADDAAEALATELLEGAGPSTPTRLVAEVASAQRRYGCLAAVYDEEGGFFPEEARLLSAYARHAAAALDAATALAEARSRERTASLLLELARALADATTEEEVCRRVVEASPGMG